MADVNGIFSMMSATSTKPSAENDQRVLDTSYFQHLDFLDPLALEPLLPGAARTETLSSQPFYPPAPALSGQIAGLTFDFSDTNTIASVIDTELHGDPSYCSPSLASLDPIRPATPPLSYVHGTTKELCERTPTIPQGSPEKPRQLPLFHYWTRDPYYSEPLAAESPSASNNILESTPPLERLHEEIYIQQSTVPTYDPVLAIETRGNVSLESTEYPEAGNGVTSSVSNRVSSLIYLHDKIQRNPHPCVECSFARVKCDSLPGQPCTRCTKLLFEARTNPTPMLGANAGESRSFILRVMFFDMQATQGLLSSLRDEAGKLSHLQHGTTLESLFTDPIVCHMASSTAPSHHGWTTGVKVIIKHLATTRSAQSDAASAKVDFPEPGLDVCQLDEFIDLAPRMKKLENVGQYEQGIISATLKIADYLGILFNWNANTVSFQQGSCGCTRAEAKNIVLETAYAMAHRIQDLMKKMVFEVNKSVTNRQDPKHDPATISCALWIIYSSLNKFQKLAWDAKSLQNLKKFLNGLHERAGGAIASIEHYRREVAFNVCCKKSANLQAYKNLVVAKKVPRAATAFTYERFRPVSYMLGMMPTFSHEQSYTDVLENSVADNDYLYDESVPYLERQPQETGSLSGLTHENLQKFDLRKPRIAYTSSLTSTAPTTASVCIESQTEMRPSPSLARNPSSHDNTDLSPDDDKDHAERLRYSGIDNVADKIYRIRFELAKLKKRKQLARPEDDAGCVDGDRHDPWYGIPEPVGPSVEQERVSLAAKAAKRLESSAWSSDNGLQQKKKRQRSTK